MNKLFTFIVACALCAGITMAADYFPVKITVPAAGTTTTSDIDLSKVFKDKAMFIERVTATCTSGNGTGTVTFASIDHGVATTIDTSTSVKSGDLYVGYPVRTETTPVVLQNIVVTNDVPLLVASTNTVSTAKPYLLKTVRVSVAQSSAVSGSTVYEAVIFVK